MRKVASRLNFHENRQVADTVKQKDLYVPQ